jgi:hypothetical protein
MRKLAILAVTGGVLGAVGGVVDPKVLEISFE